jgi:hypothetical protein
MNANGAVASLLAAAIATAASATGHTATYVEGFEDGNPSDWRFLPMDATTYIAQTGGNPGPYLTHTQTQWPWPTIRTRAATSIFTGDYRALGVSSLGLDMIVTLAQAQPHPDFTVTLMLVHDNGTPGNTSDDTRVYYNSGESIPWPGLGWKSYDFDIPSQADPPFGQLPPGWQFYDDPFGPTYDNHTWREVMENVSEVWYVGINDPAGIGFLLNWISGVDNMRMTHEQQSIPGDLNGDGVVDVFDLLILLGQWGPCGAEECTGDLDGNGAVDVFDLLILLGNWG